MSGGWTNVVPEPEGKYWRTFGSWVWEWLPLIIFIGFLLSLAIFLFAILNRPDQLLWLEEEIKVYTVQLEHGREVTCIRLTGKHGISCDWANVRIVTEIGDALVINP